MLKKWVLNFRSRRNEKKRHSPSPVSFSNARNVAIIADQREMESSEDFAKIIASLNSEGKVLSTLALCKNSKKTDSKFALFDRRDIGIFGSFKSDVLKNFLEKDYDFLICLDQKCNHIISYLVSAANAKYRVTINNQKDKNDHFELIIKPENGMTGIDVLKYLKMIHANDN